MKRALGYTLHNLENEHNRAEFLSFFEAGLVPDFVIFHQKLYKRQIINLLNKLRGKKVDPKIQEALAKVKIYNIPDINSAEAKAVFDKYNPAIVVCNSGIIKKRTLDHPTTLFINKHASHLPLYRGVNNVEWALWYNTPVYLSVLRVQYGIDEGDILWQQPCTVNVKDYKSFAKYKSDCQLELFSKVGWAIKSYFDGQSDFKPQPDRGVKLLQFYSMHPLIFQKLIKDHGLNK